MRTAVEPLRLGNEPADRARVSPMTTARGLRVSVVCMMYPLFEGGGKNGRRIEGAARGILYVDCGQPRRTTR